MTNTLHLSDSKEVPIKTWIIGILKQFIQIISPMIMNIKVCLVLFGALIALAFCTPAEKTLKNRLSEEIISKRHVRAAGSFGRKNEKKTKKNKKLRNDKKSNQKFKKNRKNNKKVKKNRKSNKKFKKNRKNKKSQKNTNRKPQKSKKVKGSDMGAEREIPQSCYNELTKYRSLPTFTNN